MIYLVFNQVWGYLVWNSCSNVTLFQLFFRGGGWERQHILVKRDCLNKVKVSSLRNLAAELGIDNVRKKDVCWRIAFLPNANFCFDADYSISFGWRIINTALSGGYLTFSRRCWWLCGPELHFTLIFSDTYSLVIESPTSLYSETFQGLEQIY